MAIHTPPTGPSLPATASPAIARSEPLATWRVGQVLAATVVSSPQAGVADLRIGRLLVKAQTGDMNLSAGQNLRLEVASLKQMPVLKLLGVMQQSPVQQALRDVLPLQQPLPLLLSALSRLSHPTAMQLTTPIAPPIAPGIVQLARALLAQLPDPARVSTAEGLRQAIRDSGLFLESKLAQTTAQVANARPDEVARDFKANLLRLVQVIRDNAASSAPAAARATPLPNTPATATAAPPPAALVAARLPAGAGTDPAAPLQRGLPPPAQIALEQIAKGQELNLTRGDLQRFAEGALARVQLNQLSSLPQERALLPEWLFELPLRRDNETDVWGLRLSQDPEQRRDNQPDSAPSWSMMLAFNLPGLGPLQTRVSLRGDRVTAQFYSQTQGILPLLAEHLPRLQARLQQAGLNVEELTCHHGEIPKGRPAATTRILDERA